MHALCQLLCEHSLAPLLAVFGKILEEIFEKSLTSSSVKFCSMAMLCQVDDKVKHLMELL